jgi:hypothetical protein
MMIVTTFSDSLTYVKIGTHSLYRQCFVWVRGLLENRFLFFEILPRITIFFQDSTSAR